ncbi:MAG: glycosyl hydrolase-related protein [Oscillospiraceae bacterium]|nr:glycosyl hydrolase-related protein [Oscillospiraceae bacterium]
MDKNTKRIYTVATAHLDTSWLWTLETTIEKLIPATMKRNFELFEKYPNYNFNFEGAYRYELMEEYYPADFARVKDWAAKGRWIPAGSSYENGDVNMPSPEALFRSILIGNNYFEKNFGKPCIDIFLPDCFGFGYALPSVMAHSGLYGFATCKLSWGSAYGRPFDIGKWYGVDGNYIFAAIKPGPYSTGVKTIRDDEGLIKRLEENISENNLPYLYKMYGTGDMGGAPNAASAKVVSDEVRDNDVCTVKVLSAGSRDIFDDLKNTLADEEKDNLPSWDEELLLTEHGAGSYTARTISNRFNRRGEQLADAAERSAAAAEYLGAFNYPAGELRTAWKRILAHHFHDDITGTSFQVCYKRNWNDYVMSLNQLANEYTAATGAAAELFDTSFAAGTPVIVNNPLEFERAEAVSAEITLPADMPFVRVFDSAGNEVLSQISKKDGEKATVAFIATLPSMSWKVYDIIPSRTKTEQAEESLKVTLKTIENGKLRVSLNDNGDIENVYDKINGREALSAPAGLCILPDVLSDNWPAWEVKYDDMMSGDKKYPSGAVFKIAESGDVRAAIEITKKFNSSTFTQTISLTSEADFVGVYNEVDWRETGKMLKAEFPLGASNENANYDIGLGVKTRTTNKRELFEVPFQKWMDITDADGSFGVSVLNDSKSGADKPDDGTLRLTCIHTPSDPYRWECSQHLLDLGLNRFSFGIYPHAGGYENGSDAKAAAFNQPMNTFITTSHRGVLHGEYSFCNISEPNVVIRAVKKEENGDRLIVRVNEMNGKKTENVRISLGKGIKTAEEILANEKYLNGAAIKDDCLVFDINPFGVKSFAITLKPSGIKKSPAGDVQLDLPFNVTGVTANGSGGGTQLLGGVSVPKELYPSVITSGGKVFKTADGKKNALCCKGQAIPLPKGTKRVHFLACSLDGDINALFKTENRTFKIKIQDAFEAIGAWDLIGLNETGYVKPDILAWNATHTHSRENGDEIGKDFYLFKYTLAVNGADSLTLPQDNRIIIFAATADNRENGARNGNSLYDSLKKRPFDYVLSERDRLLASKSAVERLLGKFVDSGKIITSPIPSIPGVFKIEDAYSQVRIILRKKFGKK